MSHKIEYHVELSNGDKEKVRAHYFTITDGGDVIFFVDSSKSDNKNPIAAFASGEWSQIKEIWNKPESASKIGRNLKDVSFLDEKELPHFKKVRNRPSYK